MDKKPKSLLSVICRTLSSYIARYSTRRELNYKRSPDLCENTFSSRTGSREAILTCIEVLDSTGNAVSAVDYGATVRLRLHVHFLKNAVVNICYHIINDSHVEVVSGSVCEGSEYIKGLSGDKSVFEFEFQALLEFGIYGINVDIGILSEHEEAIWSDKILGAISFSVVRAENRAAINSRRVVKNTVRMQHMHIPENELDDNSFFDQVNSAKFDSFPYSGFPEKIVLIASNPRVGSTLLLHGLMRMCSLSMISEFFNISNVNDFKKRWGNISNETFIKKLFMHRTPKNGVFVTKTHYHDFCNYKDVLEEYRDITYYIRIVREDRIGQAISLVKAGLTNAWNSFDTPAKKLSEADYDFDKIYGCYNWLIESDRLWDDFLATQKQQNIINVLYDTLSKNYHEEIARASEFITGTPYLPSDVPVAAYKKQADELTDCYTRMFIADAKTRGLSVL